MGVSLRKANGWEKYGLDLKTFFHDFRCDGSVIPAPSPWEGETTPNINGEERFLRGGLDGVQLQTEDDSLQAHTHDVSDAGHSHPYDDK